MTPQAAPRVLAIIPAREGSKGLPGKNLRPLAGVPLIGHTLAAAALMPSLTRCVVSTDSAEIAEVARELGGDVPFLRPAELAGDDTPMAPVLRHALVAVEEVDEPYDVVVLLDPTSPARRPPDVEAALVSLLAHDAWDGVVSVSRPPFNPSWVGVRPVDEEGTLTRYFPQAAGVVRRQDASSYLRINGSFYVWRAGFVRRMRSSWFDEGVHGMAEIPDLQAFAIDYLAEFEVLEALVAAGVVTLPWLTPGA